MKPGKVLSKKSITADEDYLYSANIKYTNISNTSISRSKFHSPATTIHYTPINRVGMTTVIHQDKIENWDTVDIHLPTRIPVFINDYLRPTNYSFQYYNDDYDGIVSSTNMMEMNVTKYDIDNLKKMTEQFYLGKADDINFMMFSSENADATLTQLLSKNTRLIHYPTSIRLHAEKVGSDNYIYATYVSRVKLTFYDTRFIVYNN